MKFTFAILSLAVLYCTTNAASIGNAKELDPLVKSVTKKITILAKNLETINPVKEIVDASEEIINAAQVLISETSDMLADENLPNEVNEKDEVKVDVMQFIAKNVVSAQEVVQVLFAEDQLDEDDWRAVLLVRSLILEAEGLQFEYGRFKSAANDEDKFLALRNIRVWCQAITKTSAALISTADDAELTLRAQVGLFDDNEEQQAPSTLDPTTTLPPAGKDETSDKQERQKRAFWSRGSWSVGTGGVTWSRGGHTINAKPTFGSGGFGARVSWTWRF